jgi:hypothetical protein
MVEIKVIPQDIDQVHRRRALGDAEPDYVVGYAGLLVVPGDPRAMRASGSAFDLGPGGSGPSHVL